MAEIVLLGSKLAFLAKPEFFGKNITPLKHFETSMNI